MLVYISGARYLSLFPVLFLVACAHMTSYYEASLPGAAANTVMGCYGPSSSVQIQSAPGFTIFANALSENADEIKVKIGIYTTKGGQFSFTSDSVFLRAETVNLARKIEMEHFINGSGQQFTKSQAGFFDFKAGDRLDTYIRVSPKINSFDVQLPDAMVNGNLMSFPAIHFQSTVKAYIGFCEA